MGDDNVAIKTLQACPRTEHTARVTPATHIVVVITNAISSKTSNCTVKVARTIV